MKRTSRSRYARAMLPRSATSPSAARKVVPEYVFRRQLTVAEGDPYSVTALRDSEKNLYNLPILRAVTARTLNLEAPADR